VERDTTVTLARSPLAASATSEQLAQWSTLGASTVRGASPCEHTRRGQVPTGAARRSRAQRRSFRQPAAPV